MHFEADTAFISRLKQNVPFPLSARCTRWHTRAFLTRRDVRYIHKTAYIYVCNVTLHSYLLVHHNIFVALYIMRENSRRLHTTVNWIGINSLEGFTIYHLINKIKFFFKIRRKIYIFKNYYLLQVTLHYLWSLLDTVIFALNYCKISNYTNYISNYK